MKEKINVSEIFGSHVFNDSVMKARLPKAVYKDLKKTIEDYGKAVDAKQDEFGRSTWGVRLDNPPYYAASYTPAVHHTMGGLRINTEAQVLNASGEVIPGFYAAGEVTGGIHGTNRVGGNAVPDALVFGKIAGANAAAQK